MVAAADIGTPPTTSGSHTEPGRSKWLQRYMRRSVLLDVLTGAAALVAAYFLAHGTYSRAIGLGHALVVGALVLLPMWLIAVAASGVYEPRLVGAGTDEYRKVLNAGLVMFATAASGAYILQVAVGRAFLLWAVPLMVLFAIVARHVHRRRLHRRRVHGHDIQQTLLVGSPDETKQVAAHLRRQHWAGFDVVGVCSTDPSQGFTFPDGSSVPTFGGSLREVHAAISAMDVDTLIVTNVSGLGPYGLRDLAWDLEGSHIQLIVAPAITDIAGPRIASRPVAGLPLLHVEAPRLSFSSRAFKAVFDRTVAVCALVLLSPLMILAALAVKVSSRGPVFYRQMRVGLGGEHFRILKFRTMVSSADTMMTQLSASNEAAAPLFKIRNDPRCTKLGRVLRRTSIDELPQLFQVLTGRMSIVGPRPPLPSEVESYDPHVHRKFLVKPGLTGLWQVSGRSELPWDEAVRLDLYYVDNWSPTMDIAICFKTLKAIIRQAGAY